MRQSSGIASYKVALERVTKDAREAANNPLKSIRDNPESTGRPDLRRKWEAEYRIEWGKIQTNELYNLVDEINEITDPLVRQVFTKMLDIVQLKGV